MLSRQHAHRQRRFGIVGQDRHDRLGNDRPVVELGGDEVHCHASELAARGDCAAMRVKPRERWQQRRVHVDDAAFEAAHEFARQDSHEAGEHDEVRLIRLHFSGERRIKFGALGEGLVIDDRRRDPVRFRERETCCVGAIADHRRNARRPGFGRAGLDDGLHVGAASGDQDHDVLHAAASLSVAYTPPTIVPLTFEPAMNTEPLPPGQQRARVLSGMRPTGALHLGHYHGALKNWVRLQAEYDCFYFVADWHALTTHYEDREIIERNVYDMVIDWLAAGIDPEKSTIFIQSRLPEHAELFTLLAMGTPLAWLERVPSYKDQIEKLKDRDLSTYGFLGSPLLQAADILIYKAAFVPVGEDQAPHVEITREVARRFNHLYGRGATVLPEPATLLTETSRLPGLDGTKMSKSLGNDIAMREEPAEVER